MKLYHGTKTKLISLQPKQAGKADNIEVPEKELLNAIYLTPNYGFALACGARPDGVTDIDEETKSITFENPQLFDPQETVYIYEFDSDAIPPENLTYVDELQFAVLNTAELIPTETHTHQAQEVEKYYELKNWKSEKNAETKLKMK
jgi:hypothetical protein